MFTYYSEFWGYFTSNTVDLRAAFTLGGDHTHPAGCSWEAHMERNNWTRKDVERFIEISEHHTARLQQRRLSA